MKKKGRNIKQKIFCEGMLEIEKKKSGIDSKECAISYSEKVKTEKDKRKTTFTQHNLSTKENLKSEAKVTTTTNKYKDEKLYGCPVCQQSLKSKSSLINHVHSHVGWKPHGCQFCDMRFTSSALLIRHVRYIHTKEKRYHCHECSSRFVEISKLKIHMRVHTGERPYQCPECSYSSKTQPCLNRHILSHRGVKPYFCDICNRRYSVKHSMMVHRLSHTGETPAFSCEFCPKSFTREFYRKIHTANMHSKVQSLSCEICNIICEDRYTYKSHKKIHKKQNHLEGNYLQRNKPYYLSKYTKIRARSKKNANNSPPCPAVEDPLIAKEQCSSISVVDYEINDTISEVLKNRQVLNLSNKAVSGSEYATFKEEVNRKLPLLPHKPLTEEKEDRNQTSNDPESLNPSNYLAKIDLLGEDESTKDFYLSTHVDFYHITKSPASIPKDDVYLSLKIEDTDYRIEKYNSSPLNKKSNKMDIEDNFGFESEEDTAI